MLLISVVTTVRNGRDSIGHTLDSVAAQSYPAKEHVVQDGASTDGTAEVVMRRALPWVRLESVADRGIYDGFNRGLRRCAGDVIGFLNCDDTYENGDVLATVVREFEDNPSVGMVFGDVKLVSASDHSRVVRYYSSERFEPARLRRGFMPAHPSLFVRRSLFDLVGAFDPGYRIAGDFEWVARAFCRARPGYRYVPRPFVRMPLGGASTSGLSATVRITRELLRACRSNGIDTNYFWLFSRFPRKISEFLVR